MFAARVLSALSRLLSPPRCAACDGELARDALFCAACDDGSSIVLERLSGGLTVVAAGRYAGSVARAITRMKYGARPDLAGPLAERLLGSVRTADVPGPCAVVPVPLHASRLCARGYNQSALVARHLSRGLGWPFLPRALIRTRATREQASLAREERLGNLAAAFRARDRVQGDVLLVDDVVTTGATVVACAEALFAAGATGVTIAAVARAGATDLDGAGGSQRAAASEPLAFR